MNATELEARPIDATVLGYLSTRTLKAMLREMKQGFEALDGNPLAPDGWAITLADAIQDVEEYLAEARG